MLSERYRPRSFEAMVGNKEARDELVAWLRRWKAKSKAALLVGPPGTGKTTSVHVIAQKMKMNLVELNASDSRSREKLNSKMRGAISSTTLAGERTLIFLDEVDGLAGRSDYGAIDFIKEAVRTSANPIVMAANNPEADEVRKLASVTTRIDFLPPTISEVLVFLRYVNGKEGIKMTDQEMLSVAEASKGDLRYALNALQGGGPTGKDQELTASQSVNAFLAATEKKEAMKALRSYPGQPREKLRDLFSSAVVSNLSEERKARALEVLSRADLLLGRIVRTQEWRLLRYLDPMLAGEFREALGGEELRYSAEAVPWMMQLRIWNDARKVRGICGLTGTRLGISSRGGLVEDFPYLAWLCADKSFRSEFLASLDLDESFERFIAKESSRLKPERARQLKER
jgi:replication factor C large subunit